MKTEADASIIDRRFIASRQLFMRCREHVTVEDVARFAPNDPGYAGYVAAFGDIVTRGEEALRREYDFNVAETISLTRWRIADSAQFRWFRLLTASVEILLDASDETPHYPIGITLADSFALEEAGDASAPVDLLSKVSEEISAMRYIRPQERAFCVLSRLLLASTDALQPAAIDALCAELEAVDARYHKWWEHPGSEWTDQPKSDEFLWSLTPHQQLHSVWLELVEQRFPVTSPRAEALKQRLLADGARWRRPPAQS